MTGVGVDQARRGLELKAVVQTGLVAGDAGVDAVALTRRRLVDELGIGQKRAGHAHHVGHAVGQNLLGHFGRVDAVGGAQRKGDFGLHLLRDPREGGARHAGDDGRHARLMPADAGVDQRGAGGFDGLGQHHHLVPGLAVGNQVEHRQAVNDDEIWPHRRAHAPHDLDRKAHAVLVGAAPVVLPLVGVGDQKLVDQIPLRAHDLDAVISGFSGQLSAAHEGANLPFDAVGGQRAGRKRRDRAFDPGGRHVERVITVAARVQNLQRDLAALVMHRLGNDPVGARGPARAEFAGGDTHPAMLGAKPPVTIRPTPPRARSAK